MRRLATLLSLALLGCLLATPPATAEAHARLDGEGVDIYVDPAVDRVFVTTEYDESLEVFDLQGHRLALLPGWTGSIGASPDGARVWVHRGHELGSVDASTLELTTYSLDSSFCPLEQAEAGGSVWFGGDCHADLGLFRLDPATGEVGPAEIEPGQEAPGPWDLTSASADPSLLYSTGGNRLYRLATTLSDGTPGLRTLQMQTANTPDPLNDLTVGDDGEVYTAGSGGVQRWDPTTLDNTGTFGATWAPTSVAVRADGMIAMADKYGDLEVYSGETGERFRRYEFPNGHELNDSSLAFAGEDLKALRGIILDTIHLVRDSQVIALLRTKSHTFDYHQPIPMKVILKSDSADRRVEFWFISPTGQERKVGSATVPVGRPLNTKVAGLSRNGRLQVRYAGDDEVEPSTDGLTVFIRAGIEDRAINYLRKQGGFYLVKASKAAMMKAKVSPHHGGDPAEIQFRVAAPGGRWQNSGLAGITLTRRSTGFGTITGSKRYIGGYRFGIRLVWQGNHDGNYTQTGPWVNYKFVS